MLNIFSCPTPNMVQADSAPSAPVLTSTPGGSGLIDLAWTWDVDPDHFIVQDSHDGGATWSDNFTVLGTLRAVPSWGDENTYRIGAFDAASVQIGDWSNAVNFPAPKVPTLTFTAPSRLDWTTNAPSGYTQIYFETSTDGVTWTLYGQIDISVLHYDSFGEPAFYRARFSDNTNFTAYSNVVLICAPVLVDAGSGEVDYDSAELAFIQAVGYGYIYIESSTDGFSFADFGSFENGDGYFLGAVSGQYYRARFGDTPVAGAGNSTTYSTVIQAS